MGIRIGTWNTAGRIRSGWQEYLLAADCDVWLLTEVSESIELPGWSRHLGRATMAARRRWAGVYSRAPLTPLPDPHVASAAAVVDGVTYCSTVLPWRSSGGEPTWPGGRLPRELHAGRTEYALDLLLGQLPRSGLVWGGDWNHALEGREYAGTQGGRAALLAVVGTLGLQVPTAPLPHRIEGLLSIDHIAVPSGAVVTDAVRLPADGLSDHEAYVVEVALAC